MQSGAMPRQRTPTVVALVTGAAKRNPGRYVDRTHEPIAPALPAKPPAHLAAPVAAVWREIHASIAADVLQTSDAITLELACVLVHQLRSDAAGFGSQRIANLRAVLASLGMSPAARSTVHAIAPLPEETEPERRPASAYFTGGPPRIA